MQQYNNDDGGPSDAPAPTTLLVFGFVAVILLYLIAIDRPAWFHIRPMSGSAQAMFNASEHVHEAATSADKRQGGAR